MSLQPKPGFRWEQVAWRRRDERPSPKCCSYCDDAIAARQSTPVTLFNDQGWAAHFCEHCSLAWFGIVRSLDEVPDSIPNITIEIDAPAPTSRKKRKR